MKVWLLETEYCGWLYFRGYQFLWIEQKCHIRWDQNSWQITFSFINNTENRSFVGTGIRG